jgi:drug/metabolite transporter (DMT)-like permease
MERSRDHARDESPRLFILAAMFGLFVIWSNSFHAIAYFRKNLGVSAVNLVSLRYGAVAPICLLWCALRWNETKRLLRRAGWRVLLIGLFIVPGYNLALNWGQGRVPPATASLIITMNPVFTYLLALALLDERVQWTKILGLAVSFLGVYLLVSVQNRQYGNGYSLAALVVLSAPLFWATATVMGKPVTADHDPLLLTFAATGAGSLPFFVLLAAGTGGTHALIRSLAPVGWIAWIHLSVLSTLLGFAVWFRALRALPASTVSAFVFLNPPLTSLFGLIWGTETFHWSTAVFGSITLAGVALSAGILRRPGRSRFEPASTDRPSPPASR